MLLLLLFDLLMEAESKINGHPKVYIWAKTGGLMLRTVWTHEGLQFEKALDIIDMQQSQMDVDQTIAIFVNECNHLYHKWSADHS